jgi:hypothetical protein
VAIGLSEYGMITRYDIRAEFSGWTVYDTVTHSPAMINHVPQTHLPLEDADDLADLLNYLQSQKSRTTSH